MKPKDAERAEIERQRRAADKVIGDRLAISLCEYRGCHCPK